MKQKNVLLFGVFFISFQLYINTSASWFTNSITKIKNGFGSNINNNGTHEYDNYLGSDLDMYTSGYYIAEDPENLPDENNVIPVYHFEDQSEFNKLPFTANCLLDVVLKQSENEYTINKLENTLKELEKEETSYKEKFQSMDQIPDNFSTALENIENQKQTIKKAIQDSNLLPVLKIESFQNTPAFYQLYHTKELAIENKEIACGSYTIAFALAIDEILHQEEPKNFLWKGALEEKTSKYFQPTEEMLEIFDIVERIKVFKASNSIFNQFTYFFLNLDQGSKNITLFDPCQLESEANHLPEEINQKEIKEKIRAESTKKAFYFMYRIGNNDGSMGHWSLFAYSKKNLEQQGIFYVDNMNNFIDTTETTARYLQDIFNN